MKINTRGANNVLDDSGSGFDSFLREEGFRDEVEAVAIKRVLPWQLEQGFSLPHRDSHLLRWAGYFRIDMETA
jgi:hypothetical protein